MNRIVLVVLILLAGLIVMTPFFVGVLAQHEVETVMYAYEVQTAPAIQIAEKSYDRGWFSSNAEWKFKYNVNPASTSDGSFSFDTLMATVTAKVHHGPVPFTTIGSESGFTPFALSVMESQMHIGLGDEIGMTIPGTTRLVLDFDGSGNIEYSSEPTSINISGTPLAVKWGGGKMSGTAGAGLSSVRGEGTIETFEISGIAAGIGNTVAIGPIKTTFDQTLTSYGFNEGSFRFTVDEVAVKTDDAAFVTLNDIAMDVTLALDGEYLDEDFEFTISNITSPMWPGGGFVLKANLGHFHAKAVKAFSDAVSSMTKNGQAMSPMAMLTPEVLEAVQLVLAGGPEFHISELRVDSPMGEIYMQMNLVLSAAAPGETVMLNLGLLNDLTADAVIRVPQMLAQQLPLMNPAAGAQLEQMVQNGVILAEGDHYVVEMEYASGVLTLNGLPMPIPIQ